MYPQMVRGEEGALSALSAAVTTEATARVPELPKVPRPTDSKEVVRGGASPSGATEASIPPYASACFCERRGDATELNLKTSQGGVPWGAHLGEGECDLLDG